MSRDTKLSSHEGSFRLMRNVSSVLYKHLVEIEHVKGSRRVNLPTL